MTIWRRISNYLVQNGMNIETEDDAKKKKRSSTFDRLWLQFGWVVIIPKANKNVKLRCEFFFSRYTYHRYFNRILTKFTVMYVFFWSLYVVFFFYLLKYPLYGWLARMWMCLRSHAHIVLKICETKLIYSHFVRWLRQFYFIFLWAKIRINAYPICNQGIEMLSQNAISL